jgi:hypothetical protein
MKTTIQHNIIRHAAVFSAMALIHGIQLPANAEEKPAPAAPAVLADGAAAKSKRVDNLHQARFIEIFLAAREAKTGTLVAACYNTLFTPSGIPE